MKYYGTFSCGCDGVVEAFGPTKNRQWIVDRKFEGLCSDCFQAQREEEREAAQVEAKAKAEEMELPVLSGTEKQVNWAVVLRQKFIDEYEKHTERRNYSDDVKADTAIVLDYVLSKYTSSSYYIDEFKDGVSISSFLRKHMDEFKGAIERSKSNELLPSKQELAEMVEESTLYPAEQKHAVPVEIVIKDSIISAKTPKNEDFRELVKSLDYRWAQDSWCWVRKIKGINGSVSDRAAELANNLLAAGFAVTVSDADIRNKAVTASFEMEHYNWIMRLTTDGKYTDRLCIKWRGMDDTLYSRAKSLPGAKWVKGLGVTVRIEHFEVIREFADLYGFRFSTVARQAIDEQIAKLAQVNRVTPSTAKTTEPAQQDGLKKILATKGEGVLDDLKDDPL